MTREGLSMLGFGTLVGAAFALLLYMITVVSLPLLLDREVDFVDRHDQQFPDSDGEPAADAGLGGPSSRR